MCDKIPQIKETLVIFMRNLSNKDTHSIFPTSLTVNYNKFLNAIKRLKKHNPFYTSIQIKEENLAWTEGDVEVNMGREGAVLEMKESTHDKMKETEEEFVSNAHRTDNDETDNFLPTHTVHTNVTITAPSERQAQQIKELVDIANRTDQASKIMNFPLLTMTLPSRKCIHRMLPNL